MSFTKKNKLLSKDDGDDLSPTVYSDDDDDGYGPSPNNLDPQEHTPYPDSVNAPIIG